VGTASQSYSPAKLKHDGENVNLPVTGKKILRWFAMPNSEEVEGGLYELCLESIHAARAKPCRFGPSTNEAALNFIAMKSNEQEFKTLKKKHFSIFHEFRRALNRNDRKPASVVILCGEKLTPDEAK
jgi:hypothetical protein